MNKFGIELSAGLEGIFSEDVVSLSTSQLMGEIGWPYYLRDSLPIVIGKFSNGEHICTLYFKNDADEKKFFDSFSTSYGSGNSVAAAKNDLKENLVDFAKDISKSTIGKYNESLEQKTRLAEILLRIPLYSVSSSTIKGELDENFVLKNEIPVQLFKLIDRKYVDGKRVDKTTYRCQGFIGDSSYCNALLIGEGDDKNQAAGNFIIRLSELNSSYWASKQSKDSLIVFKNKLLALSEGPFSEKEKEVLYHSVEGTLDRIIVPK